MQGVFRCVKTTNQLFVEFGFNEPGYAVGSQIPGAPKGRGIWELRLTDAHVLCELGWRGLLFDGGQQNASINLHRHFLFPSNVAGIFTQHAVPKQQSLIFSRSIWTRTTSLCCAPSFWVGGQAAQTFLGRVQSQLRIATTARNATRSRCSTRRWSNAGDRRGVPRDYVFTYSNCSWGTSAAALALVAQEFGYTLIVLVVGLDLFFLRDDLIAGKPVRNWTQNFDGLATPTKSDRGQLKTSDPAILKRLVDYDVYRKTGSVKVAVRSRQGARC